MRPILPGAAGPGIRLPQVCWSSPLMPSSSSPSKWADQQDSSNGLASLAAAVGSLYWRSAQRTFWGEMASGVMLDRPVVLIGHDVRPGSARRRPRGGGREAETGAFRIGE